MAGKPKGVVGLLSRYMAARRHFKDYVEPPGPPARLARLLQRGVRVFDEIWIEPEANPPIEQDAKADDLRRAIFHEDYDAMPGWNPQLLAAWRNYVLDDSPLPRKPPLLRRRPA
jgi:hypothetical protein